MLRRVKETDPSPEIRVYSIGHEGTANMHLPGIGNKTFTWIQAAVQWLADRLNLGTAVFDRHDPSTNAHDGRTQIGQVIGKSVKHIGDRLNTLAAIHIFPQFKSRPLDVASIEAEIEYDHDQYQAWPTQIHNVSGIALSNSGIDNPGFPGATLLGAVQAYVQAFGSDIKGDKLMNLSDVKQAVKELGLKPTQIFDVGDIMGDTGVVEKVKEEKATLWGTSERFKQERDELKDRVAKLEGDKAKAERDLQINTMQSKSSSVIDSILNDAERKLDDKAKTFVKRNLKSFKTEAVNDDGLKADLVKFVDATVVEYKELAKDVFGVTTTPTDDGSMFKLPPNMFVDQSKPTTPAMTPPATHGVPVTRDAILTAEMDPNVNPLIPGGKAAAAVLQRA